MVSCSGESGEAPIESNVIETPKSRIVFYEDTVYINKKGGSTMGFLSSPLPDEIEVVNNNSWLEYTPFQQYSDLGLTSMTEFKAKTNYSSKENRGYVYFRYKQSPYREQKSLMDSVYVIQLTCDSVLTENVEYLYDEHAHNFNLYTTYSDFDTFISYNENEKKYTGEWINNLSPRMGRSPKTKYSFSFDALPDDLDSRQGGIGFGQVVDVRAPGYSAHIVQRRAIIIGNKTNVMKLNAELQLDLSLSFGLMKSDIKYKSSDPSVASISDQGRIKALKEGSTMITIESADGEHISQMPLTVKKVLSADENNVQVSLGISITAPGGMKFFVSILNGSDKEIKIEKMVINNNGKTVIEDSNSPSVVGPLAAGQSKLIYFAFDSNGGYDISCRISYGLDGKLYEIGEDSGIIIK